MKNKILILLLTLLPIIGFSQNSNENVLYIVDSIPVIEEPKEGFGTLTENEIDNVVVVKDKEIIESTGYKDLNGIIYIFTKAYVQRPDSIKAIPTTKLMTKKNGAWYLKNSSTPYSGNFIDYYLSLGWCLRWVSGMDSPTKLRFRPGNPVDIRKSNKVIILLHCG